MIITTNYLANAYSDVFSCFVGGLVIQKEKVNSRAKGEGDIQPVHIIKVHFLFLHSCFV